MTGTMTGADAAWFAGPRILPVLTVPSAAMASPLADALARAGVRTVEVTLRTPDAEEVLKAMAAHGGLTVGAGTVLTADQAERAVAAGASFAVSPGLDEDVLARCEELGVPVVPGVGTASELMRALRYGIGTVKLFPAELVGGAAMVRSLAAPFPGVRFVPTGGIGPDRLGAYLAQPAVLAVGGTWMAPLDALARGAYDEIERLAADAVRRSGT
jgi:2-dehydro-3-deoxyphosphogluconate aldolase/(4S)-4-hydroxy-2-oxoglutarate aldolase